MKESEKIMDGIVYDEEDYLLSYAVDAFNRKYGDKIVRDACGIQSMAPSHGFRLGYRVTTLIGSDYVEIHMYLNPGRHNRVEMVRMEVIQNLNIKDAPGDEVYVILGEIAGNDGRYRFHWLSGLESNANPVFFQNGDYATLSDGSVLTWSN